jgi:hypothetical protein
MEGQQVMLGSSQEHVIQVDQGLADLWVFLFLSML